MVNQLIVGQFLKSAKGTIAIPSVTFDNYLVSGLLIWPPSIICEAEIDLAGCALHPISAGEKKNQFEWKEEWLRPDHTYVYSLLLVNEWSVFLLCLKCRHNQPVYLCAKHCIRWQPLGTVGETVWSWTFLRDRNAVNCHTFGQNEFIKMHVTIYTTWCEYRRPCWKAVPGRWKRFPNIRGRMRLQTDTPIFHFLAKSPSQWTEAKLKSAGTL